MKIPPPRHRRPGHDLGAPLHRFRALEARVTAAELPPRQEVARGRRFGRLYLAGLVVAGGAFGALAVLTRAPGPLLRIDVPVASAVQTVRLPLYGWVLTRASDLGYFPLSALSYVAVFAAFSSVRLRLEAVLAVGSSLLAGLTGSVLRQVIGRARPTEDVVHVARAIGSFGFPSGHVIQYTTLFGFACYVVLVAWRGAPARALVLAGLGSLVVLVGPSRVYLGAHWPSDTLGAYLLAGVWLAGTIELHVLLKDRLLGWWRGRPQRPRQLAR
jgi:membrane-associated phospholipid phosphatase